MANRGSFNTSKYDGAYLTFNWSVDSQDIVNNQTTINWNLTGAGIASGYWYMAGNFKVVINGVIVYQSANRIKLYTGTVVAQGKLTIPHDSYGSKNFSASAEAGIYYTAVNVNGSGNWDLPSIPRKALITKVFNFADTEQPKFQYSNPAGDSVNSLQACISFDGSTANIAYRDVPKGNQSYTFSLTDSERDSIRQAVIGQSGTLYFILKTVINGSTYLDSKTVVCTINDASPTFDCSYYDTNSKTVAITENNQKIIQNNSTLRIEISNAEAKKYASLKSVSVNLNGANYSGVFSGKSAVVDVGTVNISYDINASVTVFDSRGNSTTKSLAIVIEYWQLPTAVINIRRDSNYYSDCKITVSADYSLLDDKNTVAIKYRLKRSDSSAWSDYTSLENYATGQFIADNAYKWTVQVEVSDKLGSTTYNVDLAKGVPIIYFDRQKQSVGVNCFPKNEGSLEVNGKTIFDMIYPVGAIYISVNNVNPSVLFGGTWEQVQDRFLLGAGSTYSAGSIGGEANHTLTIDEMPRHNHEVDNLNASGNVTPYMTVQAQEKKGYGGNVQTMFAGGGQPHNNMPPYLAVYIWKRVT